MDGPELIFTIPTYRLRDVGQAVEAYDQHFWRNGHTVRIVVFDDSSPANQQGLMTLPLRHTLSGSMAAPAATFDDLWINGTHESTSRGSTGACGLDPCPQARRARIRQEVFRTKRSRAFVSDC